MILFWQIFLKILFVFSCIEFQKVQRFIHRQRCQHKTDRIEQLAMVSRLTAKERTIQDLRGELQHISSLRFELDQKNHTVQELRDKLQEANSSQSEMDCTY